MSKGMGTRLSRRIAPPEFSTREVRQTLQQRLRYIGSANHKLGPGDYGFHPPSNPRPSKSACDEIRPVLRKEATRLFRRGIELGMMSVFAEGGWPKYVWAVDDFDEPYEAKTKPGQSVDYHGYRLGEDDPMRHVVLTEWKRRWQQN